MFGNPFDNLLSALRTADEAADEKRGELDDVRNEVVSALDDIDNYQANLRDAIDAIESLGELSVSYEFSYELADVDLSVDF